MPLQPQQLMQLRVCKKHIRWPPWQPNSRWRFVHSHLFDNERQSINTVDRAIAPVFKTLTESSALPAQKIDVPLLAAPASTWQRLAEAKQATNCETQYAHSS